MEKMGTAMGRVFPFDPGDFGLKAQERLKVESSSKIGHRDEYDA